MTGRRWLLRIVAGAAITLLLLRLIAHVHTDYLWHASLGAASLWRAKYAALFWLRLVCGVVATAFVFANLYAVRQSVVSLVLPRRLANIDFPEEVPRPRLTWIAGALSVVIGIALAWAQRDWFGFLAARVGEPFGDSDPYFVTDLGFFVYRLPFEQSLFMWTMVMVLIVIVMVVVLYALTPSLRWDQGRLYVSGYVRRHLTMLAGTLLLLLAWHYRLEMYLLLGQGSAADGAFTALDHRVGIPADLMLAIVTLGAGLVVLWAGWSGQLRLAFAALTGVIVAVIGARQVAPFIVSRGAERDAGVRERPYEATRAGYTRRAFAADARVALVDSGIAYASIADAAAFVPIWDDEALKQAAGSRSGSASVGWIAGDSGIMAAVATDSGRSVAMYLVNAMEESGVPLQVPFGSERPTPTIYITADSSAGAIVVRDSSGQIAAPRLASTTSRIAHALAMQNVRLWLAESDSLDKVLSRRSVRERLDAIAPFFAQGSTVTPVWSADTLYWAVEMYSSSRTYPLSRRHIVAGAERAYFQYSATALVNASTGRVMLVADSARNEIADTWRHRFPELFRRPASVPVPLLRQLPPARDGARAQASAFGRYGTREIRIVGRLPDDMGPDSAIAGTPAPVIGIPGTNASAYVLPVLDNTDRLAGLFVALGGGAQRSVWLPAGANAPVWSDALDRLRAADTMSGAATLVRGFVRAIPVNGQVMLAQPRYDWRGGTPRLLYVSTFIGDSVRTSRTLLQLAGRLPETTLSSGVDFQERVRQLYDEMRRATARGDWAAFGRAFNALGTLLRTRQER